MARYLLDTNILAFLVSGDSDSISNETKAILTDYYNQLFTSSVSMVELLQLYRIRKIQPKEFKDATEMYNAIENVFFIKIIPFAKEHVNALSQLNIPADHNDPFDHSIIAQAISEKMILVSSDKKFKEYVPQNLKLAFNRR
jgi:PIN domain nuclease of toxin-antitoxin system